MTKKAIIIRTMYVIAWITFFALFFLGNRSAAFAVLGLMLLPQYFISWFHAIRE